MPISRHIPLITINKQSKPNKVQRKLYLYNKKNKIR